MAEAVLTPQEERQYGILLSDKYKAFLKYQTATFEFLEGTTFAGKTTVGAIKYMLKVAKSKQKLHIISGLDLGVIEKNIIQKELGIMDIFGGLVHYYSNGNRSHKMPHLEYRVPGGTKIIYLLGYDDRARWKKALGGQYGCIFVDEINIADMEYIREVTMRADYTIATLNPDDPQLPIYKEYIDRSRPLPQYEKDTPADILKQLNKQPEPRWVHWFMSFEHNASLTEDKKERIISTVPAGTKLYKNKILGIRGRAEGLVFPNFTYDKNVKTEEEIRNDYKFEKFTCGVDTAYSSKSDDTVAFIFQGIDKEGTLVTLEEKVMNNKETEKPFAPSDVAQDLHTFLEYCAKKWGFARYVYIDNADQATFTELRKMKRKTPSSFEYMNSDKRMSIIDRINLQLGWIEKAQYIVNQTCNYHIHEINNYSWNGNTPEDANDHTINAGQYAWIPNARFIGERMPKNDTKRKIATAKQLFR